jgi:hypothetical protein
LAEKRVFKTETIEATDSDAESSWFSAQLGRLLRLQAMPRDWHSSGAAPPNRTAIYAAIEALRQLSRMDLCPTYIGPSSDEGVCLAFESGEKYADIESFNTGELFAMTSTSTAAPEIWQVKGGDLHAAISTISSFIAS